MTRIPAHPPPVLPCAMTRDFPRHSAAWLLSGIPLPLKQGSAPTEIIAASCGMVAYGAAAEAQHYPRNSIARRFPTTSRSPHTAIPCGILRHGCYPCQFLAAFCGMVVSVRRPFMAAINRDRPRFPVAYCGMPGRPLRHSASLVPPASAGPRHVTIWQT